MSKRLSQHSLQAFSLFILILRTIDSSIIRPPYFYLKPGNQPPAGGAGSSPDRALAPFIRRLKTARRSLKDIPEKELLCNRWIVLELIWVISWKNAI
jgi:hypothetical protein